MNAPAPRPSRRLAWVATVIPALVLAAIGGGRLGRGVPLHVDEPSWVASAYYFELAAAGEWRHPDWSLLPAIESPPVGKYLFGLALRAVGRPVTTIEPLAATYERYRPVPGAWGTGTAADRRRAVADRLPSSTRWAVRDGTYPPVDPAGLRACRLVALAFGVLCAVGIGSIGLAIRGPLTGLVAGLAFALHPLAIEAATLALFDSIALAFSVAAVRLLIAATGAPRGDRALGWATLAGVALGLAIGTKMNALVVVPVALVPLVRALWLRERLLPPVAVPVVAGVVLVAINPVLLASPVAGWRALFAVPAETTEVQAGFLPDHLATATAKVAAVGELLGGHPLALVGLLAVAVAPVVAGLRRWSPRSLVAAWFGVALIAVVAWIPFPWPRYALPALPPSALLVADAAVGFVAMIGRRMSAATVGAAGSRVQS